MILFQSKMEFLKHKALKDGIQHILDKVNAIEKMSRPQSLRDIQIFLSMKPSKRLHGHKYMLLAVNHLTKWIEENSVPTAAVKAMALLLIRSIFTQHECPQTLLSDNGLNFTSQNLERGFSGFEMTRRGGWAKAIVSENMLEEDNLAPEEGALN
ncbi:hypothetical protein L0F63_001208 [Massospora cicadina]|nr:hypothetical protein L0F63_001208 [Massospora cicadina]